jgi:hypothetical protein
VVAPGISESLLFFASPPHARKTSGSKGISESPVMRLLIIAISPGVKDKKTTCSNQTTEQNREEI